MQVVEPVEVAGRDRGVAGRGDPAEERVPVEKLEALAKLKVVTYVAPQK